MKILVLSDSHGNTLALKKVIKRHTDIKHIFFLGDFSADIEMIRDDFKDKIFNTVKGNCDFSSSQKSKDITTIENTRIFYCHGHNYGVKYTTEDILAAAKENNCTLALFGHTHKAVISYRDSVYLVNPGSVSFSREGANSYAVIDITPKGIMPSIVTL